MDAFVEPLSEEASRWRMVDSSIGKLLLVSDGRALTSVRMGARESDAPRGAVREGSERGASGNGALGAAGAPGTDDLLDEAAAQLRAYFAGELRVFEVPLAPRGSAFQLRVWQALREIPYGETVSYGEIAAAVGRPDAVRAVGSTNGRNPIPVIVLCHRVIGADGSLVGFGGGLPRKRKLLELEAEHAAPRLWTGA